MAMQRSSMASSSAADLAAKLRGVLPVGSKLQSHDVPFGILCIFGPHCLVLP